MKTFVVSTSNENHFFNNLPDAERDFEWGVDTLKKIGDKGDVLLFEIPKNYDENVSEQEYFLKCIENETAVELKKEAV